MKLTKYLILILLFALPLKLILAQGGKITGRAFDAKNNEPLPFTNIVIYGTNIGSTSDLDGNFTFTGLEPGYVRLAATSVGYKEYISEDILVTNAKSVFIEIPMKETAVQLDEFVVTASPFRRVEESPLSMRSLDISEIEKNPGGNRDISRVIQSLPGVSSTVSFRNDVIVRGGGANENSFFLDGIEIPTINHFSTQGASGGPVGIINVDFIREVDYYSGAFPASKGSNLSSVFEFKMIEANKEKMNYRATVGASDLGLSVNGPITENSGLLLSVRRSYLGFLFDIIGLPFLPTYNDVQLKYKWRIDKKNEISLIGLGAIDQFELNTGIEDPDESQRFILNALPVNEQWSYTVGIVYKHFRDKGFDTWVLSRNYLDNRAYKYFQNNEIDSLKTFDYSSTEAENKLRYEHLSRVNGYKITYGAGLNYSQYTNRTFQQVFNTQSETINYNSELNIFNWSAFGQVSKSILKERLTLSLGLRMDANNYSESMSNMLDQFSPRFSASYALTEKFSINFNTGRYYQRPAYTTLGFRDNEGMLVNKNNGLTYISADHLVAGVEFLPDRNSKITFEGFYKFYQNYPFSIRDSIALANKGGDFGTVGDEEVRSESDGRAFGFEILAREKDFKGFNIILSYTFVRSEFKNIKEEYIPSAWDNRHILNLTVLKSLKKNWDVGAKWRFVGGPPYTPFDVLKSSIRPAWDVQNSPYLDYSRFNTLRYGNFHQLDVRVDKKYFFNRWSLILYVDIQNLYNFKFEDQGFYTNLDENGNLNIDPATADLPYDQQKYNLRLLPNESGTVLPTIGIIVEF
ncbi:MAG: TonB-dependent receptor [Bacteroidales bacterium]|nr:TonB-dependent receptor [Bacteroidales bacterium]MCF8402457.1 TonB-dependent receptor [Bacteroidales bacterium]